MLVSVYWDSEERICMSSGVCVIIIIYVCGVSVSIIYLNNPILTTKHFFIVTMMMMVVLYV